MTAGPKAARLTTPPQLEQIRTALIDAMSAGSPRKVITSLEPEADKLAVLTEEARQIGARIDAARAHEVEESPKERWTMPGDSANQQEKTSAQAALKGQGRRGDDRESCVSISPGRTWTWMLTWIAIAYYVRVQQQWDPTLGFPGEGGIQDAKRGAHAASAPREPGPEQCLIVLPTYMGGCVIRSPSRKGAIAATNWTTLPDMQTRARRALEDAVVLRPGGLTGWRTDEYNVTATSLLQSVDRLFLALHSLRACAVKRMTMLQRRAPDTMHQRLAGGVPRESGPERQSQTILLEHRGRHEMSPRAQRAPDDARYGSTEPDHTPGAQGETRNATESPASSR